MRWWRGVEMNHMRVAVGMLCTGWCMLVDVCSLITNAPRPGFVHACVHDCQRYHD